MEGGEDMGDLGGQPLSTSLIKNAFVHSAAATTQALV